MLVGCSTNKGGIYVSGAAVMKGYTLMKFDCVRVRESLPYVSHSSGQRSEGWHASGGYMWVRVP